MVLLKLMYLKTCTEKKKKTKKRVVRDEGSESAEPRSYLDPREEQVHRVHVVVLRLPEGQKFEIGVDVGLFQQLTEQAVHFDRPENIERDGHDGELRKRRRYTSKKRRKSEQDWAKDLAFLTRMTTMSSMFQTLLK